MKTSEVILSHGEHNDATAYPVWVIVKRCGLGKHEWLAGPWFNRVDATWYLEARRHAFGPKAFVYCFSGHESWHMRELYAIARNEAGGAA